jgi:hypothetical protein
MVVAIVEIVVVWRRQDSRSLAGLVGRTDTRSRPAIAADRAAGADI